MSVNSVSGRDEATEREALSWLDDPFEHFGWSTTRIHSVPREELAAVQLAGINIKLEQRRGQIKVLEKLADAQGITSCADLDAAAPLLLPHNVYKSYPVSLLSKQRFDKLTDWLARLTPHDLSQVDPSGCTSIDEWLTRIQSDTPLDVATSSGSSGTLSFYPKSKRDYWLTTQGMRVQLVQRFGTEPTEADLEEKIHVVLPMHRDGHALAGRTGQYLKHVFGKGDEDFYHTCFDFKASTDLMWLAARVRAAAAKGDMSQVDATPQLLARRAEWEEQQRKMPDQMRAFIERIIDELSGERVFAMGTTTLFLPLAMRGAEQGARAAFAPGSLVSGGGGAKGIVLPDNYEQIICDFFGVERFEQTYGMTEMNSLSRMCEHGRYHLMPWVVPYLLDLENGTPLPRTGVRTGRAAFLDLTHDGTWGGIVTGDLATIDWDGHCACGRTSIAIERSVQRLSELQGGDDKITCAAQPAAQAEAMDFLLNLEG